MLRTVKRALPGHVPVIGVNLGRMGYLAEVEPAAMESTRSSVSSEATTACRTAWCSRSQ